VEVVAQALQAQAQAACLGMAALVALVEFRHLVLMALRREVEAVALTQEPKQAMAHGVNFVFGGLHNGTFCNC
jgi:hypothetical protein